MRKFIFIVYIFLATSIFVFPAENFEKEKNRIIEHYKKFALYNDGEQFLLSKVYIRKATFRYIGDLYILVDINRVDRRIMLYAISELFIYPIYNLETYNNYLSTLSIFLNRNELIPYFRFFLELQRFISNNIVYSNINKTELIEKYGKYGGNGFKDKIENFFIDSPFLNFNKLRDEYEVSLSTFTVININAYYRLRTTHALISSLGIIRKIWGKNSEYFIYNGEKANLTPEQIQNFEETIY